jgi:hypothetical protein
MPTSLINSVAIRASLQSAFSFYKKEIIYFLSITSCLTICNFHSQAQNATWQCTYDPNCPKVVYLPSKEVARYAKNYSTHFSRLSKKHEKWIFIPRSYVDFMQAFFDMHDKEYDGFRIVFTSFNKIVDPDNQERKKQIMVLFAPTKNKWPIYGAFKSFVDKYPKLSPNTKNPFLSFNTSGRSHLRPEYLLTASTQVSNEYVTNYKDYFSSRRKNHTESVYINLPTFQALRESLEISKLDGFRLRFASYNKKLDCTCQVTKKQFTLVLELVGSDGSSAYTSDKAKVDQINKLLADGLNHSELCPSSCGAPTE